MSDNGHTESIDLILDALDHGDLDALRILDKRLEAVALEQVRRAEQRYGQTELHEAFHTLSSLHLKNTSSPREVAIHDDNEGEPTIRVVFHGLLTPYPHDVTVEVDGREVFVRYQDQIRVFHEGNWIDHVVEAAVRDRAAEEREALRESIQDSIDTLQSIQLPPEDDGSDVQSLYRDIFGTPALKT